MASIKARVGAYEVIETLGAGSFGKVKLAVHTLTNHKVALKFINKAKLAREHGMPQRVAREIDYLRFLRHPHIIKLYEVLHTNHDLVMVMEYAGGELFHYISDRGRMAEHEARRFLQQLVSAVEYCHRHRIVHRDLKPENLLLDSAKNLKVADFGLSNSLRDGDFLKTSCGSPNYAAPEVILGKLYAGPEVDVWSIGVILYVMLVGRLPFEDEYIPALFQKISSGQYSIPAFMSPEARSLVQHMLIVDPLKRITLAEVRTHPFFTKDLPAYLNPLPPLPHSSIGLVHHPSAPGAAADDDAEDIMPLDESIVEELAAKLNLPKDDVIARLVDPLDDETDDLADPDAEHRHLHHDPNDPVRVAYMLCADNRYLWSGTRSANALRDVHWMSGTPPMGSSAQAHAHQARPPATHPPPPTSAAQHQQQQPPPPQDVGTVKRFVPRRSLPASAHSASSSSPPPGGSGGAPASTDSPAPAAPAPPRKARSKWHVGIRSRSPPIDVMLELYKALAAVGMVWKPLGPFALRAKYEFRVGGRDPDDDDDDDDDDEEDQGGQASTTEEAASKVVAVKLDVQLYKVDTAYYLVDFKLVPPPPLPPSSAPAAANRSAASTPSSSLIATVDLLGTSASTAIDPHSLASAPASLVAGNSVASVRSAAGSRHAVRRRSSLLRSGGGGAAVAGANEVVSPYAFLDVAVRIITELASG